MTTPTNKFPQAFLDRMKTIIPAEEWDDFLTFSTQPLPKTLRRTKKSADFPADWQLDPVSELPEAFFIDRADRTQPLGKSFEHFTGEIYLASLSSLLAAKTLGVETGDKVLDLCAAPGSKTTFLAEMAGSDGVIIANELSASRIKKLAANIDRLGAFNTVICHNDGTSMYHFLEQEFDKILLDAPCSSEGHGRKSANFFRTQWYEKTIFDCANLQKKLIISAFNMLRPGGEMLYSTCTGAPEENEAVVQFLLDAFPDTVEILPIDYADIPARPGVAKFLNREFSPEVSQNVRRIYPHLRSKDWDSEVFFLAKIAKKDGLSRPPAIKNFQDRNLKRFSKNQAAEVLTKLSKYFGLPREKFSGFLVVESDGELFLTNNAAFNFAKKNKYQRVGIKLLDKYQNISQEFASHFGPHATQNILELDKAESERYLAGYDFEKSADFLIPGAFTGIALVRHGRFCLGYVKSLKNDKWKNKLDRKLVF